MQQRISLRLNCRKRLKKRSVLFLWLQGLRKANFAKNETRISAKTNPKSVCQSSNNQMMKGQAPHSNSSTSPSQGPVPPPGTHSIESHQSFPRASKASTHSNRSTSPSKRPETTRQTDLIRSLRRTSSNNNNMHNTCILFTIRHDEDNRNPLHSG